MDTTPADQAARLNPAELQTLLEKAAAEGARQALSTLGLTDESAARDMREVRDLLDAWRQAKRAAWTTLAKSVTTLLLAAAMAALGLHWFTPPGPVR